MFRAALLRRTFGNHASRRSTAARGTNTPAVTEEYCCVMDKPDQISLELWPRDHDLPPRWDGLPVDWGEWDDSGRGFVCPPPRPQCCDRCGSPRPRLFNVGRIWTDPGTAPPAIGVARLRRGRHLVGVIAAFRCPDCEHDSVLDHHEKSWDLDDTDYTDKGSWEIGSPARGDDS